MKLNEAVRKLRRENGWTQHELALKLGIQTAMISHWETEVQSVSHKNLWKMAQMAKGSLVKMFIEADGMTVAEMRDVLKKVK